MRALIGTGLVTPHAFWRLTLREVAVFFTPAAPPAMAPHRSTLNTLMEAYPDG